MRYTLRVNARFDLEGRKKWEDCLQEALSKEDLASLRREECRTYYERNHEPEYSEIALSLKGGDRNEGRFLEILEEIGLPAGSILYNETKELELGTLSHIKLSFKLNRDRSPSVRTLEKLEKIAHETLDSLCVFSANYLHEEVLKFHFYVSDLDLALGIIEKLLKKSNFLDRYEMETSRSSFGIVHRYLCVFRKRFREREKQSSTDLTAQYDRSSAQYDRSSERKSLQELFHNYPNLPKSLSEFWNFSEASSLPPLLINEHLENGVLLQLPSVMLREQEERMRMVRGLYLNKGANLAPELRENPNSWKLFLFASSTEQEKQNLLLMDLDPAEAGKVGQIFAYSASKNEFILLAPSFESFLLEALNNEFRDYFTA